MARRSGSRRSLTTGMILQATIFSGIVAAAVNFAIWYVAVNFLSVPRSFKPFNGPQGVIILTVLLGFGGATLLLLWLQNRRTPLSTFRNVAWAALVVSFLPTLALSRDGASTTLGIFMLLMMHIAAALVMITGVPKLMRK